VHEVGEDSSALMLQKPGDRVNRLAHCGHPHLSLELVGLGEPSLGWDGQVLIQCRDRTSTTFFGFQMAILIAGRSLPLDERHEVMPEIHINLSTLRWFSRCGKEYAGSRIRELLRQGDRAQANYS